ncbi:MAG: patatin-like phospholipase family protein [Lachnospiraceae bacterium]|nr:patatin-like phospholipase family protein [Lachnospiraceae bacterium]
MDKRDFGLVLGGGGGKGSYQIGVWKALRFLKMDSWITSIASDSIGTLNAVMILNGDYQKAEDAWYNIRPIQFLDITPEGVCSRDGLIKILRELVDLKKVSESPIKTYTTLARRSADTDSYQVISRAFRNRDDDLDIEGEYVTLNGKTPEELMQLLLAATAMPFVYDPVTINGVEYRDGGIYDNLPLRPLIEDGVQHLILVSLNPSYEYDLLCASRADTIIQITPSQEIGALLTGTLDFDGRNAAYRLNLGFYDTLRAFEYYERRMLGFPVSAAEKETRAREDNEKALSAANAANALASANRNFSKIDEMMKKLGL